MAALKEKTCNAYQKGDPPMTANEAKQLLPQLYQWSLNQDNQTIQRSFKFKNYYQTIAFVNAVAWIAHQQDHHPQMVVSYNRCRVSFTTHALDGLSINDFICAARIEQLDCTAA